MGTNREKMVDYQTHRRFSLRCLTNDIILISVTLKSNVKTPRGCCIIKRNEKQLLNECIRSINNSLELYGHQMNTNICHMNRVLHQTSIAECNEFI